MMAAKSHNQAISSPSTLLENVEYDRFDALSLVSYLYGPGNVACWLLTSLLCLASWTLNTNRRAQDSIYGTFVALLSYMVIAGAHLVIQLYVHPASEPFGSFVKTGTPWKLWAAIMAPARVLEMEMACCVLLFVVAVSFDECRRASVVSLIQSGYSVSLLTSICSSRYDVAYQLTQPTRSYDRFRRALFGHVRHWLHRGHIYRFGIHQIDVAL